MAATAACNKESTAMTQWILSANSELPTANSESVGACLDRRSLNGSLDGSERSVDALERLEHVASRQVGEALTPTLIAVIDPENPLLAGLGLGLDGGEQI